MQKTILLVDDDEDEFDILKQALKMVTHDCSCLWANGLEEAMTLLEEVQPDLVFIDINMPRYNGIICLKELKKIVYLQHTMFVIYSTNISETDRKSAMQLGAICIHKPENIKILYNQLTILFNDKSQCA
jgi:DNA-binding response OmpR family regulator